MDLTLDYIRFIAADRDAQRAFLRLRTASIAADGPHDAEKAGAAARAMCWAFAELLKIHGDGKAFRPLPREVALLLADYLSHLGQGVMPQPFTDAVETRGKGRPGTTLLELSGQEWAGIYLVKAERGFVPGMNAADAIMKVRELYGEGRPTGLIGKRTAEVWREEARQLDVAAFDLVLVEQQMQVAAKLYSHQLAKGLPQKRRRRKSKKKQSAA
jgi:hypothetical protein